VLYFPCVLLFLFYFLLIFNITLTMCGLGLFLYFACSSCIGFLFGSCCCLGSSFHGFFVLIIKTTVCFNAVLCMDSLFLLYSRLLCTFFWEIKTFEVHCRFCFSGPVSCALLFRHCSSCFWFAFRVPSFLFIWLYTELEN